MLSKKRAFVLFLALLPLSGCATEKMSGDLRKLENGLSDLRRFQAEQTSRISAVETELRQLAGRVEELEYSHNKRMGSEVSSLKQDLTNLRKRVPPPSIVPAAALEQDERNVENLPGEVGKPLGDGLQLIREGSFDAARAQLSELALLSQGSREQALVLFWQGIAQEGFGDNRAALETYLKLVSLSPKHQRAPLALYRQALILQRLGDKKAAKLTLGKLVADYPKSEEAARAKDRLKEL